MNRTEYIGKLNALYVGDKNCLEELITAYDEKDKEIERLNNIINELEKELKDYFNRVEINKQYVDSFYSQAVYNDIKYILDKLQELKGDGSNEKNNS